MIGFSADIPNPGRRIVRAGDVVATSARKVNQAGPPGPIRTSLSIAIT